MAMEYFYVFNLRNYTVQFADLFNEIYVRKYDENKKALDNFKYKVPILFSPFERIVLELVSEPLEKYYVKLPIISYSLIGINDDPQRRLPPIQLGKIILDANNEVAQTIRTKPPKPKILSYEVNIWAKYIDELNQIIEQIDFRFNPTVYVKLKDPNFDIDVRVPVFMEDGPTLSFEREYPQNDRRLVRATFNFKMHVWLWSEGMDWESVILEIEHRYFYKDTEEKIDEGRIYWDESTGTIKEE